MKEFEYDGFKILLGNNADENWELIKKANPLDLWIHLSNHPSPHVIIKVEKISKKKYNVPSKEAIHFACKKCIEYSKKKDNQKVKLDYTVIKNLKLGEDVGSVYYKSNKKVISVTI